MPDGGAENVHENKAGVLISISVAFICLTSMAIFLRYYAKRFSLPNITADDILITAAYILNLGLCALGIAMTFVGGVGQHVQEVRKQNPSLLVGWAKCILAFEIGYFISVALPKMAVLCLYLRIFSWKGPMRAATLIVMAITVSLSLALVLGACFQCRPMAYWWDRTIPGGKCFDVQMFFHAQAIPGFVLDSVIIVLPARTIWGLNLPMIKRIALVVVFAVASFGMIASIVRATIFFGTDALSDRTYASVDLVGWSIIETSTYVIAACLPSVKPIASHYTPQWVKDRLRQALSKAPLGTISGSRSRLRSKKEKKELMFEEPIELTESQRKHAHQDEGQDQRATTETSRPNTSRELPALKAGQSRDYQIGRSPTVCATELSRGAWPAGEERRWERKGITVTTDLRVE